MSHFTVLIIGDNPEQQLIPYQEKDGDNVDKKYLAFNDTEDEYRESWEKNEDTVKEWYADNHETIEKEAYDKILDGETYTLEGFQTFFSRVEDGKRWSFRYRDEESGDLEGEVYAEIISFENVEKEGEKLCNITFKKCVPPVETKIQEHYGTFEKYMKDYCGYDGPDEETGRYGYWHNPNAKWDWYLLGGRWTGFFKLKEGTDGIAGEPGLMTAGAGDGYADQALKKDIDIEFMENAAVERALEAYDKAQEIIKGEEFKTWDAFLAMEEIGIDKKRELYHAQPVVKRFSKSEDFGPFSSPDEYTGSREDCSTKARAEALQTFAVIKDGKWYEKGQMGWWACVHDEKDEKVWNEEFRKFINEVPEDTTLSIYDCHI